VLKIVIPKREAKTTKMIISPNYKGPERVKKSFEGLSSVISGVS
jgi:hypothetical protein